MVNKEEKKETEKKKTNNRLIEVLDKAKKNGLTYITDREILTGVNSVRQLRKRIGEIYNARSESKKSS